MTVQETDVPARAVWELWSDVPGWATWNPDVSAAEIDGPFTAGSRISMTLGDGEVVQLTLVDVQPGTGFTDEAGVDGVVLRTVHRVEPADTPGRQRVVYEMTASGPAPRQLRDEICAAVSADFPETLAALLEAAGRRSHPR